MDSVEQLKCSKIVPSVYISIYIVRTSPISGEVTDYSINECLSN